MFVTCLCVTRDRPEWLAEAVRYFQARTFEDAELLIVADGSEVKKIDAPKVRVVNLARRPVTLGEKRNIGCELATGEVIAVWDDDDYHSPARLADQVKTMARFGLPVTAYNKMKFTDGKNWWLYDGVLQSVGIGGSLCFTKKFWARCQFPELDVAEDNGLIRRAWQKREFIATAACSNLEPRLNADFMVATVHAGNTSPRDVRPGGNYSALGQSQTAFEAGIWQ